jgi:hypothetical protein
MTPVEPKKHDSGVVKAETQDGAKFNNTVLDLRPRFAGAIDIGY